MRRGTAALAAALLLAMVPGTTSAGDGDVGPTKLQPADISVPMDHFRDMLSGRSWLVTSGLDPVFSTGLGNIKDAPPGSGGGSISTQAGGGGAALVPFRDPSAKFSRNILIPNDFSQFTFQTEPSIAVDPNDPDHLLVGMIDYNFPNMVTYSSIDGGATWEGPHSAKYPRTDLGAAGDPIVAFDKDSNAYYAFISLDIQEFTIGQLLGSAVVSNISVARSTDSGITWTDPVPACKTPPCSNISATQLESSDGRDRAEIKFGFLDKPWMTIGPHPDDLDREVIYIVYTNFIQSTQVLWMDEFPFLAATDLETVIELVRSEDGGDSWSDPIEVSPRARFNILFNPVDAPRTQEEAGQGTSSRQIVQGPDVDVAPDGTVYVAWMDTTEDDSFEGRAELKVSRSDNAGVTFQTPRTAAAFLEPAFRARNAPFRSWASAFPKLGIGPNGEVYAIWMGLPSDDPNDDGDIFAVGSTDKGRNWSRRILINDDETSHFQFFPEVSVDPNGTIHAMWGDYRGDPNEVGYHIYYSTSEDGGKTWSINSRVSDFPSNPNKAFPSGRFIGDYFAIEATEDDVYMVWADSRLGEFGGANQKIAFARKRLMPSPSIFISPPSGPGGTDIVIQGFNFQPMRNVFIEVAGVIVSTTRTQGEGRFTAQIFVPISGEGAHTVRAIDASGNVASTSFFMDFGFDSIQQATDQMSDLAQSLEARGEAPGDSVLEELITIRTSLEELKTQNGNAQTGISPLVLVLIMAGGLIPILAGGGFVMVLLRRSQSRSS